MSQYPQKERKALERLGVLGKAPDADEIPHPRFPSSGRMVVVKRTANGKFGVAGEEDEYFDPIPLSDDDDRQYSVSIPKFLVALREANGIVGDGDANAGGMIPVGEKTIDGYGTIDVYLSLPNVELGIVTARCLSLHRPTGVRKLAVLVPCALRLPIPERQLLDARGIVLISLSSSADRGSLEIDWEPHVFGVPEDRLDGVYPPRTVIVAGREYKCDLTPDEMTFLTMALGSDEVELGRLIHRGQDALWRETFSNSKKTRNKVHQFVSRLNKSLAKASPQFPFFFSLPRGRTAVTRTLSEAD